MVAIYYCIYGVAFLLLFLWVPNQGICIKQAGLKFEHTRIFYVELYARLSIIVNVVSFIYLFALDPTMNLLSFIMQSFALVLFYISKRTMGKAWSTNIDSSQDMMIQSGIYKYSRNPVYVAYHLAFLSLVFQSWFQLIAYCLFTLCFHVLILEEELWLKQTFGVQFEQYKKHTRRYL